MRSELTEVRSSLAPTRIGARSLRPGGGSGAERGEGQTTLSRRGLAAPPRWGGRHGRGIGRGGLGAGVKGKINHSMAFGLPVVATTVAVEGMHLEHGSDVLLADDPVGFAEAVVAAYTDGELWKRLSSNGLANVERHFSPERARAALAAILESTPIAATV